MDKTLKVILGVLVVVGFLGFFLPRPTGLEKIETIVKEVGGIQPFARQFFGDGVTVGGLELATTTGTTLTTYTLTANEIGSEVIKINPSVDVTIQIGATSTASYIPNVGDKMSFRLKNASTTVASSLTIDDVDASTDLFLAEATGADLILAGLNEAVITIYRNGYTGTGHITVFVSEFVPD